MLMIYNIGEIIVKTLDISKEKIFYSFRTSIKDRSQMKNNDYNIIITQQQKQTIQSRPFKKTIERLPDEEGRAFVKNEYRQNYIQTIKITILSYKNNLGSIDNDIATNMASKIAVCLQGQISTNIQDERKFRILSNNFNYNDISIAEGIENEIERLEMSFRILFLDNKIELKEEIIDNIELNI
jgi:hypothetical protein